MKPKRGGANYKKAGFSVDLAPETIAEFSAFVEKRGLAKYRAVEAGLRAVMLMPAELRDLLMEGNREAVAEYYRKAGENAGKALALAALQADAAPARQTPSRHRKAGGSRG
ncbi:MAG: hypothetical protein ACE5E5_06795 [Phycisphaerae bacterium]